MTDCTLLLITTSYLPVPPLPSNNTFRRSFQVDMINESKYSIDGYEGINANLKVDFVVATEQRRQYSRSIKRHQQRYQRRGRELPSTEKSTTRDQFSNGFVFQTQSIDSQCQFARNEDGLHQTNCFELLVCGRLGNWFLCAFLQFSFLWSIFRRIAVESLLLGIQKRAVRSPI